MDNNNYKSDTLHLEDNYLTAIIQDGYSSELKQFIASQEYKTGKEFLIQKKCVDYEDAMRVFCGNKELHDNLKHNEKYPQFLHKSDFEVIHKKQQAVIIGQGVYGTVFLGKNVTTGEMVAVKAFHKKYENLNAQIKEAVITNKAQRAIGKSAPKCLGFLLLKDMDEGYSSLLNVYSFCAVLPGLPNTLSLRVALSMKNAITPMQWRDIFLSLIDSLKKLHKVDVYHMDLHAENVLLCFGEDRSSITPVIIDYGKSVSGNQQSSSANQDTVFFMQLIFRYAYEFDKEDLIAFTETYQHSDDALMYVEKYLKTGTVSDTYSLTNAEHQDMCVIS